MPALGDVGDVAHAFAASSVLRLRRVLNSYLPPNVFRQKVAVFTSPRHLRVRQKQLSSNFSLIVACHNIDEYIDDFFHSIGLQNIYPECLEIIAVDDGSTDTTAARIAYWAARFPGRVQYIYQHHQGQSAARYTGLAHATAEWITFPDPL